MPLTFTDLGDGPLAIGAIDLAPLRDDRGEIVDLVAVEMYTAGDASLRGRPLRERLSDENFDTLRRRVSTCLDTGQPRAVRVTTTDTTYHVQLVAPGTGRVMALWVDVTELAPRGPDTPGDHWAAGTLSFVLVVGADGLVEHAHWPDGAGAADGGALVGRPVDELVDRAQLDAAQSSGAARTAEVSSGRDGHDPVHAVITTQQLQDGRLLVFGRELGETPPVVESGDADRLREILGGAVDGIALYEAVRDGTKRIRDFRCLGVAGRTVIPQAHMLERSLLEAFPAAATQVFDNYVHVVTERETWTPGAFAIGEATAPRRFQIRVQPCGDGIVICWRELPDDVDGIDPPLRSRDAEAIGPPGYSLTARELEILRLVAIGATTAEIARTLYLSTHTVRNYVRRILARLEARSRSEAVATALTHRLIDLPPDRRGWPRPPV